MAETPPSQPPPDSGGIHIGDVGGSVNFSALGDIVGGNKITTITTTIQISVEAITQRPLITASPYRGLDRFEDRDKDLFFGRDQLIKSLLAQLSASNVLLVLGASGSGKSSVVRAGLLPQLAQLIGARFRYFTFVPDVNPFESLRSALHGAGFSQTQTRELAEAKAETPDRLIRSLQRNGDQWLLFVDQFEEMFTVGDEKLRASFIAALVAIAQDPNSSTKLVLAMRADFLDRFSPFPQFAKIVEKNIDFVADMHADELRQAIEQPAARHGVVFEQGLVEEIIKDVQGQAGSLPLLQYTLDLLWQEEAREDGLADRHLNTKAYRELGGVRGALQKRADEIYDSFAEGADGKTASPKQEIVRQIFLRLVDLAGEGSNDAAWRPVRRRASIAMFATGQQQEILQALINQKLLVSNREGDDATVEVAHEALFTSWGRLKNWIDAGKQVIFAKNRITDDARRWQRRQEDDPAGAEEELLSGTRLAQALDMRARGDFATVVGGLGETETRFLDASVALRDRRAKEEQTRQQRELEAAQRLAEARTLAAGRLRKGLIAAVVLLLAALAGGGFALYNARIARAETKRAGQALAMAEVRTAAAADDGNRPKEILAHLARALRIDPSQAVALRRATTILAQRKWSEVGKATRRFENVDGDSPVLETSFNADGSRLLVRTVDGRLYDLEGQKLTPFPGHEQFRQFPNGLTGATFSPDGKLIAVATGNEVQILNSATMAIKSRQVFDVPSHAPSEEKPKGAVVALCFDRESARIAIALSNGKIEIHALNASSSLSRIQDLQMELVALVAFGDTADTLACLDEHGQFALARLGSGALPPQPRVPTAIELAKYFHHTLGRIPGVLKGDGVPRFDRSQYVGGGADPRKLGEDFLRGQRGGLSFAISADGNWISSSGESEVTFTKQRANENADKKSTTRTFTHNSFISSIATSPDGRLVATASYDGTARVWNLTTGEFASDPEEHGGRVVYVAFSPDSRRLATVSRGSDSETLCVWDVSPELPLRTVQLPKTPLGEPAFQEGSDARPPLLAFRDSTNAFCVVNGTTGELLLSEPLDKEVEPEVVFDLSGRYVFLRSTSRVLAWSAEKKGVLYRILPGQGETFTAGRFNSDRSRLLLARSTGDVEIIETVSGRSLCKTSLGRSGEIRLLQFLQNADEIVAVQQSEAKITVNRRAAATLEPRLPAVEIPNVTFLYDSFFGPHVALLLAKQKNESKEDFSVHVRVWDILSGKPRSSAIPYSVKANTVFAPDGRSLVSSNSRAAFLYSIEGKELRKFPDDPNFVGGIQYSPDGTKILTSPQQAGDFKVYDIQTGAVPPGLESFIHVEKMDFSKNGALLVTPLGIVDVASGLRVSDKFNRIPTSLDQDAETLLLEPFSSEDSDVPEDGSQPAQKKELPILLQFPHVPETAPNWLPDLLEALAGARIDDVGNLQPVADSAAAFQRIYSQIPPSVAENDLGACARRLLEPAKNVAPRETRIAPPIPEKENVAIERPAANAHPKAEETTPESTRNDLAGADVRLNQVYGALRSRLGASEKEALKREQITWLAERDKITDEVKRLEFIEERVRDLERRQTEKK
jgi:WD40 repeat protein